MNLAHMPAPQVLEAYFLEARSKLLDLAAILDRLNRGRDYSAIADDPRIVRIQRALTVLAAADNDRAERIQLIFSLPFDSKWIRPTPK